MCIGVPVRARARTEADGEAAAAEKPARDGGLKDAAVLVPHDGFGRDPVDGGGNRPGQLAHDPARVVVPAPPHGFVTANRLGQFVARPRTPLFRGESGNAPVAEASGKPVLRLLHRRAVAVGQVVVNPDRAGLPRRMELGHADEIGDELRVLRTRQALRGKPVGGDHRPPVLPGAVARVEDGIRVADDRLELD